MKIYKPIIFLIFFTTNTKCFSYFNFQEYLIQSVLNDSNDTNNCFDDLKLMMNGVNNKRTWALTMIDAWAKELPSGLLYGNNMNLGNFDECLSATQTIDHHSRKRVISGQHCIVVYSVEDPRDNRTRTKWPKWDKSEFITNKTQNR